MSKLNAKLIQHALSLQELRMLWQALDEASAVQDGLSTQCTMSVITATAIKLLILTGARRGEVAGMRWDEIDFDTATWTLPSERTKNRRGHTIYLSALAIDLLKNLIPLSGQSTFIFDTGRKGRSSLIFPRFNGHIAKLLVVLQKILGLGSQVSNEDVFDYNTPKQSYFRQGVADHQSSG